MQLPPSFPSLSSIALPLPISENYDALATLIVALVRETPPPLVSPMEEMMYQWVNSTLFLPLGLQHKPINFRKPMAQAISLRTPPRHEEFNIVSIHPLRWSCLPSQMSEWLSLIFL
jgi:hypothetical protein